MQKQVQLLKWAFIHCVLSLSGRLWSATGGPSARTSHRHAPGTRPSTGTTANSCTPFACATARASAGGRTHVPIASARAATKPKTRRAKPRPPPPPPRPSPGGAPATTFFYILRHFPPFFLVSKFLKFQSRQQPEFPPIFQKFPPKRNGATIPAIFSNFPPDKWRQFSNFQVSRPKFKFKNFAPKFKFLNFAPKFIFQISRRNSFLNFAPK